MKHFVPFLLISSLFAGEGWSRESATPTRDVYVNGRLENLNYDLVDDPDDLLGHGWINARLYVTKVLRGRVAARVLDVRYFAHTYRGYPPKYRFHLRRWDNGNYVICTEDGEGARCR